MFLAWEYYWSQPRRKKKKRCRHLVEKKMHQHAQDLEFEDAAKLRDHIEFLHNNFLGFDNSDIG